MKFNTKKIIFILLAIIGVTVLTIGVLVTNIEIKTICIAIGGSLLGASLSNYFSLVGVNIYDIISNSKPIPLIDSGENIDPFRKKYYCYYLTRVKNQKQWQMYIMDLSRLSSKNYLEGNIRIKDAKNKSFEYDTIGLISGKRLVVIYKARYGNESPIIYTFPEFGKDYSDKAVGVGFFEDWQSNEMIAPMIISKSPINDNKKTGIIQDEALKGRLVELASQVYPEIIQTNHNE